MSDLRLRELERQAALGDEVAAAALLSERVRIGSLPAGNVERAAYLGHKIAQSSLGIPEGWWMSADTASGFCWGPPGKDGEWSGDDREPETMEDWMKGLAHFRVTKICEQCKGSGVRRTAQGRRVGCVSCGGTQSRNYIKRGKGKVSSPDIIFLVHCAAIAARSVHAKVCFADSGGECTDCTALRVIEDAQAWATCPCDKHQEAPAHWWRSPNIPSFAFDLHQAFTDEPMAKSRAGADDQVRRLLDSIIASSRSIGPVDVYNAILPKVAPLLLSPSTG